MDPLTEENTKLKEAMKMMEKNVQRAQRKRNLAESNVRDLEYQKGTLSGQRTTISEQLKLTSEQLRSVSEQKKGTTDRRFCSALPNNLVVADDSYVCRARGGARSVASSHWSALSGEGESI